MQNLFLVALFGVMLYQLLKDISVLDRTVYTIAYSLTEQIMVNAVTMKAVA
jgi:hypothetical protein